MNIPIQVPLPLLAIRSAVGGVFMGLANLVPGISGGTMLVAAGIYTQFINAIAELTTLKFRTVSLVVLGGVVLAAAVSILLLAGTVKELVIDQRWIMYSLFIGLTLGGVPVVWKMAKPAQRGTWVGAVVGFLAMAVLAWFQLKGASGEGAGNTGHIMLFVAGLAGASAMILPGVSGGYLLLVLGVYVPILSAIDQFKEALKAGQWGEVVSVGLHVGIPVGLGVIVGIVGVSNLLRYLLKRYEKATLGVLLGLLVGAVVGLWPFQQSVEPQVGDTIKGQVQTVESLAELDPEDFPTEFFKPTGGQVGGALGLIVVGLLVTTAVSRLGGNKDESA